MVVHDMLVAQGKLRAGEWLLVTGISAGVGVAALQTAKTLGARVIGTSGSAEKLEKLKAMGLDAGIRTRSGDFAEGVMKATGGKGANLVVNNVGGSVFAETIRALAYEGRHATVGYVDGVLKSEIDIEALHTKRLTLFGVSNRLRTAEQRADLRRGERLHDLAVEPVDDVLRRLRRRDVSVPVHRLVPGVARLGHGGHVGKQGRALWAGGRDRPDFARLDMSSDRDQRREERSDLAAEHALHCGTPALVGHVHDVDFRHHLQKLPRQVAGAADSGRCVGDRPRLAAGELDVFGERVRRQR